MTKLGLFAPNAGSLSAVDTNFPQNGMHALVSNLSSADGCFWDVERNIVFISEVFTGHVYGHDVSGVSSPPTTATANEQCP